MSEIQPAIKKETTKVAVYTGIGTILMCIIFFLGHMSAPDTVPFDYTVILGGIGGCAVAVLNFFLMGLSVQKVTSTDDQEYARNIMKASYSRRMLLQMLWVVLAIAAPCFQFVAGAIPLLFPGMGIKLMGIFHKE